MMLSTFLNGFIWHSEVEHRSHVSKILGNLFISLNTFVTGKNWFRICRFSISVPIFLFMLSLESQPRITESHAPGQIPEKCEPNALTKNRKQEEQTFQGSKSIKFFKDSLFKPRLSQLRALDTFTGVRYYKPSGFYTMKFNWGQSSRADR